MAGAFCSGAAVFSASGIADETLLVAFYNPWIDAAVFTEWQADGSGRRLTDVEWMPGDMVRSADPVIDLAPLWMRHASYPPAELSEALIATISAFEGRLGSAEGAVNWRGMLGVENISEFDGFLSPLLAARLYDSQPQPLPHWPHRAKGRTRSWRRCDGPWRG